MRNEPRISFLDWCQALVDEAWIMGRCRVVLFGLVVALVALILLRPFL